IPGDDESGKLVEAELCPLINTTFERHEPIQINHDGSLRNVEEQNRKQPKEEMRRSQLGSGADPGRADYKENLGEREIAQSERFFECNAVLFDIAFSAVQPDCHLGNVDLIVLVFCFFRWWSFDSKFVVANPAASVRDYATSF